MQNRLARTGASFLCLLLLRCGKERPELERAVNTPVSSPVERRDVHSFANPHEVIVRHLDCDWEVAFAEKVLKGAVVLTVERTAAGGSSPLGNPGDRKVPRKEDSDTFLVLDTRGLKIEKVETSSDGKAFSAARFEMGPPEKILGAALTIALAPGATQVRIAYSTGPDASALQWLEPSQTAGEKRPFLFTQSQAIHARSWIPLQDTPGVRVTYSAKVRTPKDLFAVMSAGNDPKAARDGEFTFTMPQPVPSYLIALAVGDLAFESLGKRTGVYAEPSVLPRAAREFSDTEKMVAAAERLFGPYRWGRYDILVLPPSFPFGGMENPRLTFATPTILAGDKSLVALVAHELAHSWSGNLVTNATWRDFWLNEGITTYIERRIVEEVYGLRRAEMEAVLGRQDLRKEIEKLPEKEEILHIDLAGRDPDEGFTDVPYEKGALFLRSLEELFGRERFDRFLRGYFDHFAFQSITTERFVSYLTKNLLETDAERALRIPVEEWVERPGVPASAPLPVSDAFAKVEQQAREWLSGKIPAAKIPSAAWTTHEWLHFLRALPVPLPEEKMAELDRAFRLTQSGNSEILFQWLLMAIQSRYERADARLEEFLVSMGRRKFLKPLYEELVKTPEGKERALTIYRKARPGYHPISVETVDKIVKWQP